MFWIIYRTPLDNTTTQYENDNLAEARFFLQGVVINQDTELIDFSSELDGALDHHLDGVRLYNSVTV